MDKSIRNNSNESGQTLIEALVAISIAVVGLIGIITLLTRSVAVNRELSGKFAASYLAAEGIEIVKNVEDSNYGNGRNWNYNLDDGLYQPDYSTGADDFPSAAIARPSDAVPLKFDPGTGIYRNSSGQTSLFTRMVEIKTVGDELTVSSTVTWTDENGHQEVSLEDHFFDWRNETVVTQ